MFHDKLIISVLVPIPLARGGVTLNGEKLDWARRPSLHCFLSLHPGSPAWQFIAAGDEAGAALVGQIRPCPLDHYQQAIAESNQEKDVDEQPCQPGEIAGEHELAELGNGGGAADRGQAAFIVIMEIASRLVFRSRAMVSATQSPCWMATGATRVASCRVRP